MAYYLGGRTAIEQSPLERVPLAVFASCIDVGFWATSQRTRD